MYHLVCRQKNQEIGDFFKGGLWWLSSFFSRGYGLYVMIIFFLFNNCGVQLGFLGFFLGLLDFE